MVWEHRGSQGEVVQEDIGVEEMGYVIALRAAAMKTDIGIYFYFSPK